MVTKMTVDNFVPPNRSYVCVYPHTFWETKIAFGQLFGVNELLHHQKLHITFNSYVVCNQNNLFSITFSSCQLKLSTRFP